MLRSHRWGTWDPWGRWGLILWDKWSQMIYFLPVHLLKIVNCFMPDSKNKQGLQTYCTHAYFKHAYVYFNHSVPSLALKFKEIVLSFCYHLLSELMTLTFCGVQSKNHEELYWSFFSMQLRWMGTEDFILNFEEQFPSIKKRVVCFPVYTNQYK